MSNFREELQNTTVSKDVIIIEMQKEFDEIVHCIYDKVISETYEQIKKDILLKSKSGMYDSINSKKHITGYIKIDSFISYNHNFTNPQKMYLRTLMPSDNDFSKIKHLFLKNHQDMYFSVKKGLDEIICVLISKENRKRLFNGYCYRFFLTDSAQKILEGLKKKAILDDITVCFSHIEVGDSKIENGGESKNDLDTKMFVKYSIVF